MLSVLCTQSWAFDLLFNSFLNRGAQDFLSDPLFPSAGDDDSVPVVALERDAESSEGEAVL